MVLKFVLKWKTLTFVQFRERDKFMSANIRNLLVTAQEISKNEERAISSNIEKNIPDYLTF